MIDLQFASTQNLGLLKRDRSPFRDNLKQNLRDISLKKFNKDPKNLLNNKTGELKEFITEQKHQMEIKSLQGKIKEEIQNTIKKEELMDTASSNRFKSKGNKVLSLTNLMSGI